MAGEQAAPSEPRQFAVAGLHDALEAAFRQRVSPPARVLDLGAGTGAWARRLRGRGYAVTAMDRNRDNFSCPEIPFVQADLNLDFSREAPGPFDAVTAIEVIEHLENPRHFLREIGKLLAANGLAFVTTPNIQNVNARLRFLAKGELRYFGTNPALNDPTHITPIHTDMFERMLRDSGFELAHHGFSNPRSTLSRPAIRLLARLLDPLLAGVKGGDCHVFVLSKR